MPFKPLITAGVENVLNTFLYRSPALKTARQRLNGKVLRVVVKEFSTPLVLVFSERQLDVLGEWEGEADCSVITHMSTLPKLRDRQQLTALIRSGELEVQGDLQVVQNFVSLADLCPDISILRRYLHISLTRSRLHIRNPLRICGSSPAAPRNQLRHWLYCSPLSTRSPMLMKKAAALSLA